MDACMDLFRQLGEGLPPSAPMLLPRERLEALSVCPCSPVTTHPVGGGPFVVSVINVAVTSFRDETTQPTLMAWATGGKSDGAHDGDCLPRKRQLTAEPPLHQPQRCRYRP